MIRGLSEDERLVVACEALALALLTIAIFVWAPNLAYGATQYSLSITNGHSASTIPTSAYFLGGGTYYHGARRSVLTTVPASMPLLTVPGEEFGVAAIQTTNVVWWPGYGPPANHSDLGWPSGLTNDAHTFLNAWCYDYTVTWLSSLQLDQRNSHTSQYIVDHNQAFSFGIVKTPSVSVGAANVVAPSYWSSAIPGVSLNSGYSLPSAGFASTQTSRTPAAYASSNGIAVIHAYGGESLSTTGSPRYWWHASGQFGYSDEYQGAGVTYTVDTTGSLTPPTLYMSDSTTRTPTNWRQGYMYGSPAYDAYYGMPNYYGMNSLTSQSVFDAIGGYSEDTATVAYYSSHIATNAADPLTPVPTPGTDTSSSAVPTSTDYTSLLPTAPDWTTLLNPASWGSYLTGAIAQLQNAFQSTVSGFQGAFTFSGWQK